MLRTKQRLQVYLSGPMSGIEEFNIPAFAHAAAELRKNGFEVFVPGENEEYDDEEMLSWEVSRKKREYYLSRDIYEIIEKADLVVVLPGWTQSEGAKLEVAVAQAVGLPIFEFETAALLKRRVRLMATSEYDC